ncbi:MAG: winged helix-turn-helix transcriptional regulator [Phycisphaerae bacterium]|nr:winged helix-turn-helix transcriptional regulator [Phycisphaerae bacterium]
MRYDENWYGVATMVAIVETQGRERQVRVGGLKRLYRRPAQRPRHKLVEETPDEALAKLLCAFAHPQRVAIIKAIFTGAGTYADLRERVGLKAGPMYHHLRELKLAGVLADGPRDVYRLTRQGKDALILACSLATLHDRNRARK